jgi:hypothetical protein
MTPVQDQRFNATLQLGLQMQDEVAVDHVDLYYYYIGESSFGDLPAPDVNYTKFQTISGDDIQYTRIETSETDVFGTQAYVASYSWDTSLLAQGLYAVKAVAVNKGNQSSTYVKKYFKDTTPPDAPTDVVISDPATGKTLNLVWSSVLMSNSMKLEKYRFPKSLLTIQQ